jgi:hypothetical protein
MVWLALSLYSKLSVFCLIIFVVHVFIFAVSDQFVSLSMDEKAI